MGWYTTYTISVELTECLTKDFAETLVENGGFNVCGEGTTLMLTTDYKRGGLSQLADIMDNLSFKLNGMYKSMTGTFEGQDGYAEMQLDAHRKMAGADREMAGTDCDCREIVYRVLGNGKEKWLEIQYVFNLPKPKLIRLTADGKRAGAKGTLDTEDSDDYHCYEAKKKRGLKKIPKSDTEDEAKDTASKPKISTEDYEEMIREMEATERLSKEPDAVKPSTEELDADDIAEMEAFATLNDVGGAVIGQDDDPVSAVVNGDTGDTPANNEEEPDEQDTDSEQDAKQAPRKAGWCRCGNRFDIYSDDE